MLALGAGLEYTDAPGNTVIDTLVITGLEVQGVVITVGTPVAAVQRVLACKKHGGGDVLSLFLGEYHEQVLRLFAAEAQEKLQIEIGQGAALHEGQADQAVYGPPRRGVQLVAVQVSESDAGFGNPATVAPSLFAFRGAEGCEKIVEVVITPVVPVELAVLADLESGRLEQRQLLVQRKQHVYR